jgi:hypothetical protein
MKRPALRAFALACFALALAAPAAADEEADRNAAVVAATRQAEQWLQAMDMHRYPDSWSNAASVMKQGRTEQDWEAEVSGPREALGRATMRELKRAEFSTRVRGAPQGEYVMVVYLTKFSNIPPVTETVVLTRENGQWLIGAYSVAQASEGASEPASAQPAPAQPAPSPPASAGSPPKPKE